MPPYVWMLSIYLAAPLYVWMLPNLWWHPKVWGTSKHMGGVQTYRGIYTYGGIQIYGGIWTPPQFDKACFLCVLYVQQAYGGIQTYGGASKYMGVSTHIQGASKHTGAQTYRGYPTKWGLPLVEIITIHVYVVVWRIKLSTHIMVSLFSSEACWYLQLLGKRGH